MSLIAQFKLFILLANLAGNTQTEGVVQTPVIHMDTKNCEKFQTGSIDEIQTGVPGAQGLFNV